MNIISRISKIADNGENTATNLVIGDVPINKNEKEENEKKKN